MHARDARAHYRHRRVTGGSRISRDMAGVPVLSLGGSRLRYPLVGRIRRQSGNAGMQNSGWQAEMEYGAWQVCGGVEVGAPGPGGRDVFCTCGQLRQNPGAGTRGFEDSPGRPRTQINTRTIASVLSGPPFPVHKSLLKIYSRSISRVFLSPVPSRSREASRGVEALRFR